MHFIVFVLLFSSVLSLKDTKWCRLRTDVFPEQLWNMAAGGACYSYLKGTWLKQNLTLGKCRFTVDEKNYLIYCAQYMDGTRFYFDYTNSTSAYLIETELMIEGFYSKWLNCALAADDCCTNHMTNENIYPHDKFSCPTIWDSWTCFPAAERATISKQPCPDYTSSSNSTPCILYSEKECFSHGEWNQSTNYGTCPTASVYRRRHKFNVIVCYVAIALCFPAVVIFMSFEKLRTTRINLHRNLLIACIVRNILNILSKELVLLDSLKSSTQTNYVLEGNGVACRVLAFFTSASVNSVYACMLMDGLYLHKLIARVFSSDPSQVMIYSVTFGFTFLPTLVWAAFVATQDNTNCWMVDTSWYQWILDGFRVGILAINMILLFDIARVLCQKLHKDRSKEHSKSTFKVMIFLTILFGVPFLFTANRNIIDKDSCVSGDVYYFSSYIIQSLQGVMVAVLFCYFNKEVQNQFKEIFRKTHIKTQNRLSTVNFRRFTKTRQDTSGTFLSNTSKTFEAKRLSINHERKNQEAVKKLSDLIEASASNPHHETQSEAKNEDSLSNRISRFIDDSITDPQSYENNNLK